MSAVLQAREPAARDVDAVQPAVVRQFGLLAAAEGGVARLRELILTLAVQGKLVPQCPSDAPASELLARARAAAAEQRRERGKSASNSIEPFEPDQGSPALPRGWEWCRGVDLYTVVRGVTYQKADASDSQRDNYLPILRANNIRTTINFDDLVHVPANLVKEEQLLRPGDFVVCLASGSKNLVGKAAMFTGERVCSFGAFCGAIRLAVPLPFFSVFLASPLYRDAVSEASSGIGINNLRSSTLLGLAIALPPEAEQARIVARVDELMRLCDALEAKGRLEAEQHARLLSTLLGTLADSSTPEELASNWQRVADHLDLLLDRPEAVDALEQTVLQLAVRGLLVPQDPEDEPVDLLLQEIQADRRRLLGDNPAKAARAYPAINEGDRRFDLPAGWRWVRLSEISIVIVDCPHSTAKFVDSGLLCLDTNSFKDGKLLTHKLRFVSQETFDARVARLRPEPGDLVFAREGSVGESIIIPPGTVCCLGQRVMLFRLSTRVSTEFVRLAISTKDFLDALLSMHKGIGAKHVNVGDMRDAVVPLPPPREQQRVLDRVTELRSMCAELRQRLDRSSVTQAALAGALIDQALAA